MWTGGCAGGIFDAGNNSANM